MELGNAAFGNSRGPFPVPDRREFEFHIERLVGAITCEQSWYDVPPFDNGIFWLMPYWWGDCTCGWGLIDHGHRRAHKLKHRPECFTVWYERNIYHLILLGRQDERMARLKREYEKRGWDTTSKNWWHGCAARCDCDYPDRYEAIIKEYAEEFGHDGHRPHCLLVVDNFHYRPAKFGLQWYKYPCRDAYTNREITVEGFAAIIDDCIAGLKDFEPQKPWYILENEEYWSDLEWVTEVKRR